MSGPKSQRTSGLPDRSREGLNLPRPARPLGELAAQMVLSTAYRTLQRDSDAPFLKKPGRPALPRLYYQASDGWQAALFRLEASPGTPGEPVLLAHGLGVNRHTLDWDGEISLARSLSDAGFSVYLMEHRGDPSAVAPEGAADFDFDDIAAMDVPAAIDAVRDYTGFPRVHWVGHALGGQLLYAHLAHSRGDGVGACAALCAPVRFPVSPSARRAAAIARQLLPSGARLPTRAAAAVMAPGVRDTSPLSGSELAAPLSRGLLVHGVEDLPGALARQVLRWLSSGNLCDRHDRMDYLEALQGIDVPLMLVSARGDTLCPPEAASPVLAHLVGPQEVLILDSDWGHMDPLLGRRAGEKVFPRIAAWLDRHRRRAWED